LKPSEVSPIFFATIDDILFISLIVCMAFQPADITVSGKKIGVIEVYYLEEKPELAE